MALQFGNAPFHCSGDFILNAIEIEIFGDAEACSFQVGQQGKIEIGTSKRRATRIQRVGTGNFVHCKRTIFGTGAEGPNVVKAEGERQETVAANASISRLQTGNAAIRSGDTNRSTSVGTEAERQEARCHQSSRPAARATRDAGRVAWIQHESVVWIA